MSEKEKMLEVISELFDAQNGSPEEKEQANKNFDELINDLEALRESLNEEENTYSEPKKKPNKKIQGIIRNIMYYFIPIYAILFVIFFFSGNFLRDYILQLPEIKQNTQYSILINLIPLGFMICFAAIVYLGVRGRYYHKVTGRSLSVDKGRYKRSYYELLEYFRGNNETEMNEEDLPVTNWKNAEGVILGKSKKGRLISVPSGKDGRNYMIFGLPGSGKTAGPIICSALRFGMNRPLEKGYEKTDGSVFCIDIKNDIYNATHEYRDIKRFNLMDEENSCCFNPFDGVEKMSTDDKCNFIENIGFNIIPPASDGENRYFTDTAYDFWNGIALQMLHEEPGLSFPNVVDVILKSSPETWINYVVKTGCDEAKRRLANKQGENEKNLAGGYSTLCQHLRKFASERLSRLLGNDEDMEYISPQMLEDGYDVYVSVDQSELANYAPLLSMIVQTFFTGFIKRERNPKAGRLPDGTLRPILMMLDEFAQLRTLKYESVASAFMTLRSKNVSIACALQSRSSLVEVYKTENACSALIDCVTTFCFLSIQEVSTREWASKLIGKQKVLKISNSLNSGGGQKGGKSLGKTVNEAEEPIIAPEVFGNLIDRNHGRDEVIIYSQGKYIRADKQYYFK